MAIPESVTRSSPERRQGGVLKVRRWKLHDHAHRVLVLVLAAGVSWTADVLSKNLSFLVYVSGPQRELKTIGFGIFLFCKSDDL